MAHMNHSRYDHITMNNFKAFYTSGVKALIRSQCVVRRIHAHATNKPVIDSRCIMLFGSCVLNRFYASTRSTIVFVFFCFVGRRRPLQLPYYNNCDINDKQNNNKRNTKIFLTFCTLKKFGSNAVLKK